MGELLDSLREKDEDAFHQWTHSEAWGTVEQLLEAHGTTSYCLNQVFPSLANQQFGGREARTNFGPMAYGAKFNIKDGVIY